MEVLLKRATTINRLITQGSIHIISKVENLSRDEQKDLQYHSLCCVCNYDNNRKDAT